MPAATYKVEFYDWPDDSHYRLIRFYPGSDYRMHVARSHGNSLGDKQDLEMICITLNDEAARTAMSGTR